MFCLWALTWGPPSRNLALLNEKGQWMIQMLQGDPLGSCCCSRVMAQAGQLASTGEPGGVSGTHRDHGVGLTSLVPSLIDTPESQLTYSEGMGGE